MKQVDKLFKNAIVVTVDDKYSIYEMGAVAVDGDAIVAVGYEKDLCASYTGAETIDCGGKVLMPGLVNVHTHVPMTLLRGLSDDLRLDVWLMGYIMPVEREFVSPEMVVLGTKIACAEMIRCGTTSFADMYYFEKEIAKTTAAAGMRAVCGESVLMFPSPDAACYEDALKICEDYIKEFKGHPLIVPAVAPHAPYTTNPEILQACADLAIKYDVPVLMHLAETASEVEGVNSQYGQNVINYAKAQRLLDTKLSGAHLVHIDESEMREMARHGCGGAHNPTSNMKLASGAAPVTKMVELGMNVGIGTDGPSSNNDLDMFEEMRLASFLAKLQTSDPTSLPAKTIIYMATKGGAKSIHIEDITGSIEVGKRADMILVDVSPIHNSPRFKRDADGIYAQLVYASKATDVTDVMVNGKWLLKDKALLTIDETSLRKEAQEFAARVDAFLAEREQSLLSKLVAIGGATQDESFEIQAKVKISDINAVIAKLRASNIEIRAEKHYKQFDTYFKFENTNEMVRYREDELLDDNGKTISVRPRLTLIGEAKHGITKEAKHLLSRSRYIAPAGNSLRFYREYFKPESIFEVEKNRERFHITFEGNNFFINLDKLVKPGLGQYIEVKATTFSSNDAEVKTELVGKLLATLGLDQGSSIHEDYHELE
jgi:5-methylthioadenosine/S-adenosylhomocysteine deaminase